MCERSKLIGLQRHTFCWQQNKMQRVGTFYRRLSDLIHSLALIVAKPAELSQINLVHPHLYEVVQLGLLHNFYGTPHEWVHEQRFDYCYSLRGRYPSVCPSETKVDYVWCKIWRWCVHKSNRNIGLSLSGRDFDWYHFGLHPSPGVSPKNWIGGSWATVMRRLFCFSAISMAPELPTQYLCHGQLKAQAMFPVNRNWEPVGDFKHVEALKHGIEWYNLILCIINVQNFTVY